MPLPERRTRRRKIQERNRERGKSEMVAVYTVAARRLGSVIADIPTVINCRSEPFERLALCQAGFKCENVVEPPMIECASGSSTTSVKLFVPSGAPVHSSGGARLSPSRAYCGGIGFPSMNAALVRLKGMPFHRLHVA